MSDEDRDALERQVRCQCGCTLDVYICRTTDFSCQVSPAMHRDIISLVEGGYEAKEIIDAFVTTYGEKALMPVTVLCAAVAAGLPCCRASKKPKREGFNLAGYIVPFAALALGSVALTIFLRRMQNRAAQPRETVASAPRPTSGTSDEMAKLQAAIRRDE